MTDMYSVSKYL